MLKSVRRVSVLKCKTNDGLILTPRVSWIHIFRRCTGILEKTKALTHENSVMSFAAYMEERRAQARRSLLVKFEDIKYAKKLFTLCKVYGNIKDAYCCEQFKSHYLVIEMQEENCVNEILQNVYGQRFHGCCNQFLILDNHKNNLFNCTEDGKFNTYVKTCEYNSGKKVLNGELSKRVNTLNDTIRNCYNAVKINEFEIRKKFLTCDQIEKFCGGFMENYVAYPFGSSVSGFGVNGSDLDIALIPGNHSESRQEFSFQSDCSTVTIRKHLGIINEVMKNFINWASEVNFIKHARVPIVKFNNNFTNIECDLSIYNSHGVAMTQMYYSLASIDWKIRALVIFVKLWANKVGLTSKKVTTKPTNFSLCVLVLFFLQQVKMLPPLSIFPCKDSQYLDEFEPETESILNDMRKNHKNDKSVEDLLKEFLDFYTSFDFLKWGISLKNGKPVLNVDKYPIYLENPIYDGVNISSNVRRNDIDDFQALLVDAGMILKGKSDQEQIRSFFNLSLKSKKTVNIFKCIDNDVEVC